MLKTSFSILVLCLMGCKPPEGEATQQIQTPETQTSADTFEPYTDTLMNTADTLSREQAALVLKRINPKFRKPSDISTIKAEKLPAAYLNLLKTHERYADSSEAYGPFFRMLNAELDKHYSNLEQESALPDSARLQIASVMSDLRGKLSKKPELKAESR